MNALTSFVTIASLLLALATAGTVVNKQTDVNSPAASRNITPSKLGLNHNETMVSDAALVQQADTVKWLMNVQTSILTRFSIYLSGRCEDWGCGTNHNETLVRDVAR